jgi:hypothetical protein
MSLTQGQILERAATLLQDTSNRRWLATELRKYIWDAQHEFIRLTQFPIVTSSVTITDDQAVFDRPSSPPLMNLQRVRISNTAVEIPIVTPNQLDENTVILGQVVEADWRKQRGPIRAIVLEHMSSPTFRVFPYPRSTDSMFSSNLLSAIPAYDIVGDSATDVLVYGGSVITTITETAALNFEGVLETPTDRIRPTGDSTESPYVNGDTELPMISPTFHEALVWGCVERAYLKENELRNIEKSNMFRQRFLEQVASARRLEPQNTLTRNTGVNKKRFHAGWRWR